MSRSSSSASSSSAASGAAEAYLICATPRTGSSLLCGLLASTGVAGHPEAYFRRQNEPERAEEWGILDSDGHFGYGDFVRAALAAGRTQNHVFGAKVMWGTLEEIVDKLGPVHPGLAGRDLELLERAFGRTRFVHVRREDVVAQAVSRLRAEQTNEWQFDERPEGEPAFDFEGVDHYVREAHEHNEGWERWFESFGIEPHRVRYEDLVADLATVTRGVLDFLGLELPAGAAIEARHRRQADGLNAEWIARYRAESPHRRGR